MDDLVQRILWLAIEDYAGLWEVVWELNTARPPRPGDSNEALAGKIVAQLLRSGLVTLYREAVPGGTMEPIGLDEAPALIEGSSAWQPPSWGASALRLSATEAGEQAYSHLFDRR